MMNKHTLSVRFILIFALLFFVKIASSQSVDLDWIELKGDRVIVHYNLDDSNPSRQYLVSLYSSKDNFSAPLTRVTGDVGTEVRPGNDKKITWDITKELGAYKGEIAFELRSRIFVPFVKLVDFSENKVFKRGKNYPLVWTSGNLGGQVNVELFNGKQERVWGENNVPNSGKYDWFLPGSLKKGEGYRLKFTNAKDRSDVQYSMPFKVKAKVPFIVKALGVLAIGVIVKVATGGNSNSGGGTLPETPLPNFPTEPK